ncbi:MAG: amino acid permease [bacterium]
MPGSKANSVKIHTELSRDLGLVSALAIGVGTMIAAGIFTLSGLAIRNVGSAAIVSFLLAAIVALFTALTYCEFVSIYPRSGEGYLYARKTFPAPLAYFVGWSLILGYTASCAFYIASLSSYFIEFIWHTPIEGISGIVFLIALILLNIKGTKESGSFQVVVTIGKVVLLAWFIVGSIGYVNAGEIIQRFSTDMVKIGGTAAMVFITFFGFSAIAASAGEVKNPVKNIPRAIFLSMGIVTILYTLVVLAILAAGLTEYTEAAMGSAAQKFLGSIGGMVIVAGALFSMISASNASIMAGSRVIMSMSRLGHLPVEFGTINPNTRTPVVSLILVGGTILAFATSLQLEDLAHFADTVLLLALILVNAALIYHRKKFPKIERPFRVPLVPLLPALGILANLYLMSQLLHHIVPVLMAGASLLLGVLGFLAWKGTQAEEVVLPGTPSRVALGRYAEGTGGFRVLVTLANPANATRLVGMAAAIASEKNGEIVALRVGQVPEQMPPSFEEDMFIEKERPILELAHRCAKEHDVPMTSLLRIGHNAARAILETARERDCDLIIMGWKGYTKTSKKILGEITDAVVAHARTDIMLVKLVGDGPLQKFLLPTAGGEHARQAEEYTAPLIHANKGSLTVSSVIMPGISEEIHHEVEERLTQAVSRIEATNGVHVDSEIIEHHSVTDGILEFSENYDAIVVGATGRGMLPQLLFGQIPEIIAKQSNRTVILVKHYHPVKALLGRVMRE